MIFGHNDIGNQCRQITKSRLVMAINKVCKVR